MSDVSVTEGVGGSIALLFGVILGNIEVILIFTDIMLLKLDRLVSVVVA